MRKLSRIATVPSFLLALLLVTTAFNVAQRYGAADVTTYLTNEDPEPVVVRVRDKWTERDLGTWRVDPGRTVVLVSTRLDDWWAGPWPGQPDGARTHELRLEALGPDCDRIAETASHYQWLHAVFRETDGFAETSGGGPGLQLGEDPRPETTARPAATADPCRGRPAPPRGTVINLTRRPISVGPGVTIAACSARTFHPGDLARPDTNRTKASIHLAIPSIDAQDEQWPLEPRSVVVRHDAVEDSAWGAVTVDTDEPCEGSPPKSARKSGDS
jgi:hypothetical protein